MLGAVVGAIGGFWLGVLLSLFLLKAPQDLSALLIGGTLGAVAGAGIGALLPKPLTVVLYPLALFGGGS